MSTRFLRLITITVLVVNVCAPVAAQAQAAPQAAQLVSPAGMLNPDGTLKIDGVFNGALDLSGFDVQLDAARGPIFSPTGNASATPGQWAALGEGGGAITDQVKGIAVDGTDVYVAGYFTDVGNIP